VSPQRDVTRLARRAVSAARPPACPPAMLQMTTADDDDDRRQTPTDASNQNNTGPLGRPVIMNNHIIGN